MSTSDAAQSEVRAMQQGETLFAAGRFPDAVPFYESLGEGPFSCQKHFGLGRIAMLENRLDEAERLLRQAAGHCTAREPIAWLVDLARRRGRLDVAATHLREMGAEDAARAFERAAACAPVAEVSGTAELPFEGDSHLPVVKASVNGRQGLFLVDSGAEEMVVDERLAAAARLETAGRAQAALFPGGRVARFRQSIADEARLGGVVLRHVPVQVQAIRDSFAWALGVGIDGIIGCSTLYHFRATFDWGGRRLILAADLPAVEQGCGTAFYLAGAFLPVVPVLINGTHRANMLLDTGLSGFAVAGSLSALKSAGATITEGKAVIGRGGGGNVPLIPVRLERLALGRLEVAAPRAACMLHFPLAYRFGFHLSGLLGSAFFAGKPSVTLDFKNMSLSVA